jgi:nucleoside-diphosphate-sugar epimerase
MNALLNLQMPIKRFIYLSSLSIFGAIKEKKPYLEITEHDLPKAQYGLRQEQAEGGAVSWIR